MGAHEELEAAERQVARLKHIILEREDEIDLLRSAVNDLKNRCADLTRWLGEWREMHLAHVAQIEELHVDKDNLLRDLGQAQEAVRDFAGHQSWRCQYPGRYPWGDDCQCGLVATLRRLGMDGMAEEVVQWALDNDPEAKKQ